MRREIEDVDRRRRYRRVVRTVEYQTGGDGTANEMAPAVRERCVRVILTRAGYQPSGVRASLAAAAENGDVVRFRDVEGVRRVARATEQQLRAVARWGAERDGPDRAAVAAANRALTD